MQKLNGISIVTETINAGGHFVGTGLLCILAANKYYYKYYYKYFHNFVCFEDGLNKDAIIIYIAADLTLFVSQ